MNTKRIEKETARQISAGLTGKSSVQADSGAMAGDRQIEEIERTFTLRYEW